MFVNEQPRFEVLAPESLEVLDAGWKRIVSEIGIEFLLPASLDLFRAHGQIRRATLPLDPAFVLEQVARAPGTVRRPGPEPRPALLIGGRDYGLLRRLRAAVRPRGGVRRDGTLHDFERLIRLVQGADELDTPGGVICEPNDLPLDSPHLRMVRGPHDTRGQPYSVR